MDWNAFRRPRRLAVQSTLAVAALLTVAACGGGDDGGGASGGDGLPDTIKVVSTNPLTGVVAFAGEGANRGYELAIKEINESDFLEGTTLELEKADTKSEPQTAASEMTSALSDDGISAVFGSVSSQEALAQSSLAQQQGMPVIFTQAGSEGVIVGDYTWRATPMMSEYYPLTEQFIEEQGWKSVGIIYTQATPTLSEIGSKTLPSMLEEMDIEVTNSIGTQATTQDFRAPISQILSDDPDGVAILQVGAANATAMTQLRQAGYDGKVLGNSGASVGNLEPAGKDGAGMIWPVDFHHKMSAASSQEYVTLYEEEYGEKPTNYSAEAYDAAWFLAKAIKEADSADREAIKDAMATVAEESFDGALGTGLRWEDNDLVVPGVVVEWVGDGEEILYEGSSE
jgi:branched-chain amino acid transport system substrate-binding protein